MGAEMTEPFIREVTGELNAINSFAYFEADNRINRRIRFFAVNGMHTPPVMNEYLNIWIYSTPSPNITPSIGLSRRELLNRRWSRTAPSFPNSGTGRVICDDSGTAIAELFDHNLYILHPLVNIFNVNRADFNVLIELLNKISYNYTQQNTSRIIPTPIVTQISESKDQLFSRKKASFISFCKELEFRKVSALENDVNNARQTVAKLSKDFVVATRNLKELERNLVSYGADVERAVAAYERELEYIKSIDKVIDVDINTSTKVISVKTDHLYCEDPRNHVIHDIGKFVININFSNNYCISFQNLTRRIGEKHHPHINGHGYACLGNFSEVLPHLVMRNEYSSLIIMAIKFIESVDTGDCWGATISSWPVKAAVTI